MNLSMFCTVFAQLNSMNPQSQRTRRKIILRDLKGTTSLTFLLGLTWGFAFFAWGPVRIFFLYLFAIFNTLQGFLIFVFYCMMKESVREQWQTHLCCGWLRLDNSSGKMPVRHKQERLKKTFQHKVFSPSFKSPATSSTFKSLGSAQCIPSETSFPNGERQSDHIHGLGKYFFLKTKGTRAGIYLGLFLAETVCLEAPSEGCLGGSVG
uniref:Adhesion G protein-coupled receptor G4 n=1 Tax=Panthera leo TaxID=9689 RepID=A0A8C8X6J8_PANLE